MKYLINLLFLLGAAFFLGGCSDNGDPVDTPRLEVSESSRLVIGGAGKWTSRRI